MDYTKRVKELISLTLEVRLDALSDESSPENVPEWDSIGHLNLMLALEDELQVRIDADSIARLSSIPAIVSFLEQNE